MITGAGEVQPFTASSQPGRQARMQRLDRITPVGAFAFYAPDLLIVHKLEHCFAGGTVLATLPVVSEWVHP